MPVNGALPAEVFLDCQLVAAAGLFQAEQTAADGGNNFRLAPDDPAMGTWWRQISNSEGAAIGTDDVIYAGTQLT